jgi:hypothetical protein
MALTQLRGRKADAYKVDLRLEARETVLPGSPLACCWDLRGDRLLFARDIWRYKVIAGTDEIYDSGYVDTEIVALPAAELPLSSAAAGTVLLRLDRVPRAEIPAEELVFSLRVVDVIAADPLDDFFAIYHHRADVGPPYETWLSTYNSNGELFSVASWLQPDDGAPPWSVPHAVVDNGWVYGIERDNVWRAEPGPAVGIVTKRGIGTPATAIATWSPEDRWIYPHSVSVGADRLWVLMTKLFNPGPDSFQLSYIASLTLDELLGPVGIQIDFGFGDPPDRYHLGDWQAAGDRNTGGLCLYEAAAEDEAGTPIFLASALTPDGWPPVLPDLPETQLFRWSLTFPGGSYLGDVGEAMPIPMSRTPAGLCGNLAGELPEIRDL